MKYLPHLFIVFCLMSCTNEIKNRDANLNKSIYHFLDSCLTDKITLTRLDSVKVIYVDSITQKFIINSKIEEHQRIFDATKDLVELYHNQEEFNLRMISLSTYDEYDRRKYKNKFDETMSKYKQEVANMTMEEQIIDSFRHIFKSADSISFYGFMTKTQYKFNRKGEVHTDTVTLYVDNNFKPRLIP